MTPFQPIKKKMPHMKRSLFPLLVLGLLISSSFSATAQEKEVKKDKASEEWIQLFNGKNLEGWTPKIRGHELGENFGNTFRVSKEGNLQVGYEKYDKFGERFGHLFYDKEYSNYIIRVEYRFVGQQCKEGPGWATRNSGIMVHGQDPKTMTKGQDFPASIEVQLLGGDGKKKRTTLNLCTPSTNVVMEGKLVRRHCISSKSETYHGEQWVTATVEVRGNKFIKHIVDGVTVLEYQKPQLDDRDAVGKMLIEKQDGKVELSGGSISLQSESHPVEFRKVELKVLTD